MSDLRRDGEAPDVLQTATQYRDHLKAELAEVEEFLLMAGELSRASEHTGLSSSAKCNTCRVEGLEFLGRAGDAIQGKHL